MYAASEFDDGGITVRSEWLTLTTKEIYWPHDNDIFRFFFQLMFE